jgi:hypothetical protein
MKEITIRISSGDVEAVIWALTKVAEEEPSDNARYYRRLRDSIRAQERKQ